MNINLLGNREEKNTELLRRCYYSHDIATSKNVYLNFNPY